jgi:isoleucyl-tRNA synthetase
VSAPEAVTVHVEHAEGTKCLRCWRFQTDISTDPAFEGICGRCVEAVSLNRRNRRPERPPQA